MTSWRCEPFNDPRALERLRTEFRVRQPPRAKHPLIRAARRACQVPVYYFGRRPGLRISFGDSPSDVLYEGDVLYVGPVESQASNGIIHDLCHLMVADTRGKRGRVNFDANDDEERLTAKIEFWLAFVSGYWTYPTLIKHVCDYNYSDGLEWTDEPELGTFTLRQVRRWRRDRELGLVSDDVVPKSVEKFLVQCREQALKVPLARKVARELGVTSLRALRTRLEPWARRFDRTHMPR